MSQRQRILNHLLSGRTITPLQALHRFGCFRLGARIWDLRQAGHRIEKSWDENGRKRWARYKLVKAA